MINGSVDGFSRMIICMKRAKSNKDEILCNIFLHSIEEFQCPFRIWGDKGGETRIIAKHLMMLRGTEIKGYMCRRSTHNTRIERSCR